MRWNPDDLFGGYFDFNDDGVTDTGESWIAYNIMNDNTTFSSDNDDDDDDDDDDEYSTTRYHYSPRTNAYQSTGAYNQSSSYSSPQSSLPSVKKDDYAWKRRLGHVYLHGIYSDDYETEEEFWKAVDDERNPWRKYADDGSKYGLNPRNFKTEEEYMHALTAAKYAWRITAADGSPYGVFPEHYETEEEFNNALEVRKRIHELYAQTELSDEQESCIQNEAQTDEDKERLVEILADKTLYSYCGVMFDFSDSAYCYRFENMDLKVGDKVIAPVGDENAEKEGTVVSVGQYLHVNVPQPVGKTKCILRKV